MNNENKFSYNTNTKRIVQLKGTDITMFLLVFVFTFLLIQSAVLVNAFVLTVSYFALFAVASIYLISKFGFNKKALFPGVLSLLTALSFSLHGFENVFIFSFFMLMYLSGVYCTELTDSANFSNGSYFYFFDLYKLVVKIPLKNLFLPFRSLKTLKGTKRKPKKARTALGVVIGFLCALPLLFIIINLLIDGDAAFESVVGNIVEKIGEYLEKITDALSKFYDNSLFNGFCFVATLIFAPYIYNVIFCFSYKVSEEENKDMSHKYKSIRKIPTSVFSTFLGVISLVYVLYLFSQSAYLFSAFTGHLPGGVSINITQYARRGFFEMAMIATVNFFLIAAAVLFSKRNGEKLSKPNKYISLFLCIFTIILISTSISKILLYIFKMGLTEKRLYVFVFDIALCVAFLCIIIRLFNEKFAYMKTITTVACCLLTALSLIGVENIVSGYNTQMYLSGRHDSVDLEIMTFHSVKRLEKLSQSNDKEISSLAKEELGNHYCYYWINENLIDASSDPLICSNITSLDDLLSFKFLKANSDKYKSYVTSVTKFNLIIDSQVTCNDLKVYYYSYAMALFDEETLENSKRSLTFIEDNYSLVLDELEDYIEGFAIVFKDENMKEYSFNASQNKVEIKKENGKIVCKNR